MNVSLRCGFRLNADQIRCTVVCDTPVLSAMLRTDQCVASFGIVVSVRSTTSATLSSVTVRGRPDLYSSERPSMRFSANRLRHFPTVCSCTPVRRAISPAPEPLGAEKDDPAAVGQRPRCLVLSDMRLEKRALLGAQHHFNRLASHRTASC